MIFILFGRWAVRVHGLSGGRLRSNLGRALALIVASVPFAGCVAPPELIAAQTYDFGAAPTTAQDQIKLYFGRTLKDPMSATYEFYEPFKGRCDVDWLDPSAEFAIGWVVRVNVNAKNSYGGYTGAQPYAFFFAADQTMKDVVGGNKFGRGGSCRPISAAVVGS